jgi:hypothetical protein
MRLFVLLVIFAGIQLVTGHFTGIKGKTCTKDKECNSISYCWKPEFGFTSSIKRIQRCKSKCGLHGGTYNYCYISKNNWDICTPSQETGDPHCFPKTDHLLWIGCIIAVFIGIFIFCCRKRYNIPRAEVNLGVFKVDIEKRNQDNENSPNAEDQKILSSIECVVKDAVDLQQEVDVNYNTSVFQTLGQTTPSIESDAYNENPQNIVADNQNSLSFINRQMAFVQL